jgi:predicted TIM-barrel fold metal-dependent hydrolase
MSAKSSTRKGCFKREGSVILKTMSSPKIDFHAHFFRDPTQNFFEKPKKILRPWVRLVSEQVHHVQPWIRHLPQGLVKEVDRWSVFGLWPFMLNEFSLQDLLEQVNENQIDYVVAIAHPPLLSNELLLEVAQENPKIIAAVNITPGTPEPDQVLKDFYARGAKVLKIHPASDGEDADHPHYLKLLEAAQDLQIPVILHTGCINSKLLYKKPHMGHIENFTEWFKNFKDLKIVLAHMNYHFPVKALELAQDYPNLFVDTSWQPAEMIGEAVRRIGAERVLLGSDWPILGDNMRIAMARVQDAVNSGWITEKDSDLILGVNAAKLLGL